MSFAIIRGRNGRRHEVDLGDAQIKIDVAIDDAADLHVMAIGWPGLQRGPRWRSGMRRSTRRARPRRHSSRNTSSRSGRPNVRRAPARNLGRRTRRLCMPRVDADDRNAKVAQALPMPCRGRACLEADAHSFRPRIAESRSQELMAQRPFAPPTARSLSRRRCRWRFL
jgi:hypothetical protein